MEDNNVPRSVSFVLVPLCIIQDKEYKLAYCVAPDLGSFSTVKNQPSPSLMTQSTIDPSTLFAQFAPDLYFENPVPITHDDDPDTWYLIAQQIVPTSKFEFWATIVKNHGCHCNT